MNYFKTNISLLAKSILKSIGVFAITLIAINTGAFFSSIISTGFYGEKSSLFQQSAFSMEGLAIATYLNGQALVAFFLFILLAVLAHEAKMKMVDKVSRSKSGSITPVKEMEGNNGFQKILSDKTA